MSLDRATVEQLAEHLENAELERREVVKITDSHPDMSWDDAYDIQEAIRARKAGRGGKVAGLKMGLTSKAKMNQMGVDDPIYGFLTDYGAVRDGGEIKVSGLIHPKIEAEIAFVLKAPLRGGGCTVEQVLAATDFVMPALEVIDSRYLDFKFDLKSVIADNTSAARFVVGGAPRSPVGLDLPNLGLVMMKNGSIAATAAGSEVLGDPALSVAMLADMLAKRGRELPAGTLILTGGATIAVPVEAGDNITLRVQNLGDVSVRFV